MTQRPRLSRRELRLQREQQRRLGKTGVAESTVPEVPAGAYSHSDSQAVEPTHQIFASPITDFLPGDTTGDTSQGGNAHRQDPKKEAHARLAMAQARLEEIKQKEAQLAVATPHDGSLANNDNLIGVTSRRRRRFDVIAWFGELLVTAGVVLGLFAFWQVFVTDMQVEADTKLALTTFYQDVECPTAVSSDKRKDAPPAIEPPEHGATFGALHVPKWEFMVLPLREGATPDVLDKAAAGHYDTTALPGEIGNFAVAAHRRSYGSSFRRIDVLKDGDPVVVETKDAWLVYRVYTHEIVLPERKEVIYPVPNQLNVQPTEQLMTMTTCHPEYGNSERYIVHLKFDYWTPHDAGIPAELEGGGNHSCM
ncbi:MAG: class E sortase [Actinomycetaceae bacterium]|nr:class E sortase [Actinomycetaceae bacterium]